jgi:ABC-type branched-subunit amino acid transport system ATPase component
MAALLEVTDLNAGYGPLTVLHGVSFTVEQGGITTLLGANGAGKTTTLRAVCGTVKPRGSIVLGGEPIAGRATEDIVRRGVAHVPDGRGTFLNLTTRVATKPALRRISSAAFSTSRASGSGALSRPERCPAASSRCWRSRVR